LVLRERGEAAKIEPCVQNNSRTANCELYFKKTLFCETRSIGFLAMCPE
jgi:hypothetical protein